MHVSAHESPPRTRGGRRVEVRSIGTSRSVRLAISQLLLVSSLLVAAMVPTTAAAAGSNGVLDLTFNTTGIVSTPIGTGVDSAQAVAVQADGKVVAAGYATSATEDFAVARYTAAGVLDTTFNTDGKLTITFGTGDERASAIAIQADGKIVVAGTSFIGSTDQFAVARFTTAGALDTTFNGDGKLTIPVLSGNNRAYAMAIQTDGRILVAGTADNSANYQTAVVRLTTAGVLDTTFSGDGRVVNQISATAYDEAASIAIQTDGKIVLGGSAYVAGYDFAVSRYTTAGALDTTFSTNGWMTTGVGTADDLSYGIDLQVDGKIVVAGDATSANSDFGVIRVTTAGALDTTFSGDGKQLVTFGTGLDIARAINVQADGTIVVSGESLIGSFVAFATARLTTVGALDTTFSGDGKVTTSIGASDDSAYAQAIQTDGKIVLAGNSSGNFGLLRYGSSPPTITDNQLGDLTQRSSNTGSYDVDFGDAIGVTRFETRAFSAAGQTGTMYQDWTQVGTLTGTSATANWSLLASTWTALANGTNYVSVRVWNSSGYSTTLSDAFTVAKDAVLPTNAGTVADGTGADIAFTKVVASLSANWPAGADTAPGSVASYDWCIVATAASTVCAAPVAIGSVAAPTTTVTTSIGGPFLNGTTYFVCVRSVDAAGNVAAAYACSNGQTVDTTLPAPPTSVLDGTTPPDIDAAAALPLWANWSGASDTAPGQLAGYDWCYNETADCTTSPVETGSAAAAGSSAPSTSGAYAPGTMYYFCVRSRDVATNASGYACSDGQAFALSLSVAVTAYDASGAGPFGGATPTSSFGPLVMNDTATAEMRVAVTTNSVSGYVLSAHDPDAGGAATSGGGVPLPWVTGGSVPAPVAWSGSGIGISVFGGSASPARWCVGGQVNCTTKDSASLLWAPLTGTAQQVSGAPGPVSGDTTRLPVRVAVPVSQAAGSYSGVIAITVVANG